MINLEFLTEQNLDAVRAIHREDVSEEFVDSVDTLMELTRYGLEHNCIGHTYAIKHGEAYIGAILLGEAIPWDTDPEEMKAEPFYRLMGFVLDSRCRSQGIGGYVLETVIEKIYAEYGARPIALGIHKDNHAAERFYTKHGFHKTTAMEGEDVYYLRYPQEHMTIKLQARTAEHVRIYFEKASDPEVKKWLPQKAKTVEEAMDDFYKTCQPDATSYGRTIYADDRYVGDIWCYCIGEEEEPDAMLSYCVFEKHCWGKGIATRALELFLEELRGKYGLKHIGAFTYSGNRASTRVLLKNGFALREEFTENGVRSAYWQKDL